MPWRKKESKELVAFFVAINFASSHQA